MSVSFSHAKLTIWQLGAKNAINKSCSLMKKTGNVACNVSGD